MLGEVGGVDRAEGRVLRQGGRHKIQQLKPAPIAFLRGKKGEKKKYYFKETIYHPRKIPATTQTGGFYSPQKKKKAELLENRTVKRRGTGISRGLKRGVFAVREHMGVSSPDNYSWLRGTGVGDR